MDDDDRKNPEGGRAEGGRAYWERYGEPIDLDNPGDSRALVLGRVDAAPQRILELGCSAGYMTEVLAERGHRVTAVEIDREAAQLAAPFAERLVVGDLDHVGPDGHHLFDDFEAGSFDTLLAADVLEHLREPTACLRRALDLVKPDGTVVLSIPNIAHGDVRLALLSGRFEYRDHGLLDRTHVQFFTLASLLDMIREVGLVPEAWQRTVRPLGETEIEIDENILEFGRRVLADDPEVDTYQWIVTCRRSSAVAAVAAVWPEPSRADRVVTGVLELLNAPVARPADGASAARDADAPRTAGQRVRRIAATVRNRLVARLSR